MPVYNARRSLSAGLASVFRQTFDDFEIIVCDDGSMDGSGEFARRLLSEWGEDRWTVLDGGGLGAGGARNRGIEAARGEYVAFLDDDDLWEPEKLAVCVEELHLGRLDLVCHSEVWAGESGSTRVRRYRDLFDGAKPAVVSLMRNNPFSTSAVVVRRDRLLEAGLFDESLPSAEDYDLWIRLTLLPGFRLKFIDRPLGTYLLREGSESSSVDRRFQALMEIGRRYRPHLLSVSRWGRLEHWMYRAKTLFTTGLRYVQQGRWWTGLRMALAGFLMWPFRLDWIIILFKERERGK